MDNDLFSLARSPRYLGPARGTVAAAPPDDRTAPKGGSDRGFAGHLRATGSGASLDRPPGHEAMVAWTLAERFRQTGSPARTETPDNASAARLPDRAPTLDALMAGAPFKPRPMAAAGTKADGADGFFGENGFDGDDLLDIINPLHHLPIVDMIYRGITGDKISPGARVIGGGLIGGPLGFVSGMVKVGIEKSTGRSLGGHLRSAVGFDQAPEETPEATLAPQAIAAPTQPICHEFRMGPQCKSAFDVAEEAQSLAPRGLSLAVPPSGRPTLATGVPAGAGGLKDNTPRHVWKADPKHAAATYTRTTHRTLASRPRGDW